MKKQMLSLNKNLQVAAGKTKAEFAMWLIWFLPSRPSFCEARLPWGRLGVSAENKKEGIVWGWVPRSEGK